MIHTNSTISLATSAAISAVLILTSMPVALGQDTRASVAASPAEAASHAQGLFREALALSATKERALARSKLQEAARLWVRIGESELAAKAALQVGDAYEQAQIFDEALSYYKKALEIAPPNAVKAIASRSVGDVYAKLYQRDFASRYYTDAIKFARMSRYTPAEARALTGLAVLHYKMGEQSKALSFIREAQRLNREQGDEDARAASLHLIGRMNGPVDERRKALEDALAIYQRRGDKTGQVLVLSSLSGLKLALADNQQALALAVQAKDVAEDIYRQAVTSADKLRVREPRWHAFYALARAQRALGQNSNANNSYSRATSDLELIWLLVQRATDYGSVAFREELQAPYRELVDLKVEMGQFVEAYDESQNSRARSISTLIQARRSSRIPEATRQDGKLRELSRSIVALRARLASLPTNSAQEVKLEQELREAELAFDEEHLKVEMEQSTYRSAYSKPVAVASLQKKTLADDESVLEFFLGESRSFAWLISSKAVSFEILPGRREIEEAATKYLTLISTAPSNLRIEQELSTQKKSAGELSSLLLGRFLDQLVPGKKLFIVPDGILSYFPFETLTHNGHYLIEDHQISYLPSAKMLELLQDSGRPRTADDRMELLAFGDPVFDQGSKRSGGKKSQNHEDKAYRTARGFHLASLPRSREEVSYIANLFPPDRRHVYLGKESTESHLKHELLRKFRRIHFATHSLIDEQYPSRSAVVLTLAEDPDEDGLLDVNEISELDLDCDLVVLSACQTGRGQLHSGEGILGLSRAFLYAGARSLVVSQWNVSDISTARLMKAFYERLAGNAENAAALREAKLQMLQAGGETRHPHYWAPFIVVGAR